MLNNLQRLHKVNITATDISSQFWCERQMELNCLHGSKKTYAMKVGTQMHAQMQVQVYKFLEATPRNYADSMFKSAYENLSGLDTLMGSGLCREFKIFGSVNGYRITGKIDQLGMKDGMVTISEQKTIGKNKSLAEASTRPHRIQIMLYRKLLDDIRKGRYTLENFTNSYGIQRMQMTDDFKKELEAAGVSAEMMSIESAYSRMFSRIAQLPEISDTLEIHYIDRKANEEVEMLPVEYSDSSIDKHLMHAMRFWNGDRESQPVIEEEKWKCNSCPFFGEQCKVWYNR